MRVVVPGSGDYDHRSGRPNRSRLKVGSSVSPRIWPPFVTQAHWTTTCAGRIRAVLALVVACACGALASGASAVTADPAGGAPVIGSASGPQVASAASAPAPGPSQSSNVIIVGQAPNGPAAPAPAPASGGPVRYEPAVLAAGASADPVGRPSGPPAARGPIDTQIVTTAPHRLLPSSPRPSVAQLDSGGPLVGSAAGSGAAAAKVQVRRPAPAPATGLAALSRPLPLFTAPPAAVHPLSVSVAMEGVYLSASTSAHRPGQRAPAAAGPPVGPAGLGSVTLASPWGPGSPAPGGSAWLGNAPASSPSTSGISLSGLTAVLAAMTLLAGVSWRRRPCLWPQDGLNSLLSASALDRPG